eukprot:GDKI01003444.1.p1 GENE.GDKI01003444.1~~GDKI01003444.1.p1  ORF type:complete len:142 (+),score=22.68 GDKI01003444.1:74-499(+)
MVVQQMYVHCHTHTKPRRTLRHTAAQTQQSTAANSTQTHSPVTALCCCCCYPHHTTHKSCLLCCVALPVTLLVDVVVEELFDEISVCENHSSAAVALKLEGIKGLTFSFILLQELQPTLPHVTNHLTARKATNGDNHLEVT